jgi:hypothetical protein
MGGVSGTIMEFTNLVSSRTTFSIALQTILWKNCCVKTGRREIFLVTYDDHSRSDIHQLTRIMPSSHDRVFLLLITRRRFKKLMYSHHVLNSLFTCRRRFVVKHVLEKQHTCVIIEAHMPENKRSAHAPPILVLF